ncbi:MAG: AMP-binding protein [Cyanobacteria bacterium P01_H01_bin.15]
MVAIPTTDIFATLKHRGDWLVGWPTATFLDAVDRKIKTLIAQPPARLLINQADSQQFLISFFAAVATKTPVFLGNPQWGQEAWSSVLEQVQPDLIWGDVPLGLSVVQSTHQSETHQIPSGLIAIATGGSSGKIRFAMHTWDTLWAAAQGFYVFFESQPVHSLCLLPLHHVSGLMQVVRSFLSGGQLHTQSYSAVKQGWRGDFSEHHWFISLVPTQLHFLVNETPHWLTQFRAVLVGGGPSQRALLDQAAANGIPVAPCYGMTETAAMVTVLKPKLFLAGDRSCGKPLPHVQLQIQDEIVAMGSSSLFLGFYPQRQSIDFWATQDCGQLNTDGHLEIYGRRDRMMITGGEKVAPLTVETAIWETGLVEDVVVLGIPDPHWGEAVVAMYVGDVKPVRLQRAPELQSLSVYCRPKFFFPLPQLGRSAQGKLNYAALRQKAIKLRSQNDETYSGR